MCNLYSMTTAQEAIRRLFKVDRDEAGNLPSLPGIFPNYVAPILQVRNGQRTLSTYRWGCRVRPSHCRVARSIPA